MNYEKIYNDLVEKRLNYPPHKDEYVERHHIVMRSLGGTNNKDNLVALTGREHWLAHLLLHKIHKLPQTAHACNMMAMRCEERGIPYVKNSRMYAAIRMEFAKLSSKRMKIAQKGEKNSQYGRIWISNVEQQVTKPIPKTSPIPEGWVVGRKAWNKLARQELSKQKKLERKANIDNEYIDAFYKFKNSQYKSIRQFCLSGETKFKVTPLTMAWRRLIPEYSKVTMRTQNAHKTIFQRC